MSVQWKKFLLRAGGLALSGLALGTTVSAARKKPVPVSPPWWIPDPPPAFSILTEDLQWKREGREISSHLEYACQPTQFELWQLLDLELYRVRSERRPARNSLPIFHVVLRVHLHDHGQVLPPFDDERFYATIHTHRGKTATTLASCVQVGRYVEFRKCYVGGSLNGIETGERIVSMAPVREIREAAVDSGKQDGPRGRQDSSPG